MHGGITFGKGNARPIREVVRADDFGAGILPRRTPVGIASVAVGTGLGRAALYPMTVLMISRGEVGFELAEVEVDVGLDEGLGMPFGRG